MIAYYFDADSLVDWAEGRASSAGEKEKKIASRVEELVLDSSVRTAVSEITLAEFHSQTCAKWRNSNRADLDQAWADMVETGLMKWIEQGAVEVLSVPPKLIEKAMAYVQFVTREKQRGLKAWDAAHVHQAVEWSRELGQKVVVVTKDKDFEKLLEVYPEFGRFIELLDPAD